MDELRQLSSDASQWMVDMQSEEQKQTKISPLLKAAARVGYSSSRVRKTKNSKTESFVTTLDKVSQKN